MPLEWNGVEMEAEVGMLGGLELTWGSIGWMKTMIGWPEKEEMERRKDSVLLLYSSADCECFSHAITRATGTWVGKVMRPCSHHDDTDVFHFCL